MKLRILGDHVRLRLDRDEVDSIAAGNAVISETNFPGGDVLRCSLRTGGSKVAASFSGETIAVVVPAAAARAWAASPTEVSIAGSVAHDDGELGILIEKDFECLEPRDGETQSNRFPNPAVVR